MRAAVFRLSDYVEHIFLEDCDTVFVFGAIRSGWLPARVVCYLCAHCTLHLYEIAIDVVASTLSLAGDSSASLESTGARVLLSQASEGDVVPVLWRTPLSFDYYELKFEASGMPNVLGATEVLLRSGEGSALLVTGSAYISVDVWDLEKGSWFEVHSRYVRSPAVETLDELRLSWTNRMDIPR